MKTIKLIGLAIGVILAGHYVAAPILKGAIWLTGGISYSIHRDFENGWNWANKNMKIIP